MTNPAPAKEKTPEKPLTLEELSNRLAVLSTDLSALQTSVGKIEPTTSAAQQSVSAATGPPPFRKELQDLWIAGTVGALLAAIAEKLPDIVAAERTFLRQSAPPVDLAYTADRFLQFGYAFFFLAYFFVANILNKRDHDLTWRDILFDIGQSAGGLIVVWALGFVSAKPPLSIGHAVVTSNAVIIVIAVGALALFWKDKNSGKANPQRVVGFVVALVACATWWPPISRATSDGFVKGANVLLLTALGGVLSWYAWARLHEVGATDTTQTRRDPA